MRAESKQLCSRLHNDQHALDASDAVAANVRISAATNADLETAILENRFRQDLFYQIDLFPIHLPPLRARKDDILPLTNLFMQKYAAQMNVKSGVSAHLP